MLSLNVVRKKRLTITPRDIGYNLRWKNATHMVAGMQFIKRVFHKLKISYVWKMFEQVSGNFIKLIRSGYRSNAFAPVVWWSAIVDVILITAHQISNNEMIRNGCVIMIFFTVVFAAVMYFVILNKDPRLLQSERFRLEDKKLDMFITKGSGIQIGPVNLTPPMIEEEGEDNA